MKNFVSCKNNSRFSKVFFSMALILALLVSTIIPTMAEGETAADFGGYDTKYTHVYSPMDLITPSTASTTPKVTSHISSGDNKNTYDSSIWKFGLFGADEVVGITRTTNRFTAGTDSTNGYIGFLNNDVHGGTYKFYCSTVAAADASSTFTKRTIQYEGEKGEQMAFGFTAPVSGTYEIAAPLKKISGAEKGFTYFVSKNDFETLLQDKVVGVTDIDGRFCDLIVDLEEGDTVWLVVRLAAPTTVDIGIPQAILLDNAIVKTEDTTTYKFRAIDYLENVTTNGISYDTNATTANTKAAWETGYISDIASKGTYVLENMTMPTSNEDVGAELDVRVIDAMKPYDILINGRIYYGKTFREQTDGTLYTISAQTYYQPGAMHITKDTSIANVTSAVYTGSAYTASGSIVAGANYYRFTAPVSGTATVNLNSDNATIDFKSSTRLVVIHSYEEETQDGIQTKNTVKYVLDNIDETNSTFTIENINAGEQITLLYNGYNKNSSQINIGSPLVEITRANPTYATISYDANGGVVVGEYEEQALVGSTVTFPQAEKENAVFKGWYDYATDTAYPYPRVKEVVITGDITFTARYNYFGDITGDRILNEDDLAMYRRYLLELEALPDSAFSEPDANRDGNVDICDLVRAYRLISETTVS